MLIEIALPPHGSEGPMLAFNPCVCVQMCAQAWGGQRTNEGIVSQCHLPWLVETGAPTGLELTNQATSAGQ